MGSAFDELFNEEQEYPFAYFVVCLGFLMILVIEQIVLSCTENQNQPKAEVGDPSCNCENVIRSGLPGIYLLYIYICGDKCFIILIVLNIYDNYKLLCHGKI